MEEEIKETNESGNSNEEINNNEKDIDTSNEDVENKTNNEEDEITALKKRIEELENDLSGTIPVEEGNQTRILNIKWEWPYQTGENPEEIESNDLIDTQDAKNISNYTFDVIVTGNQIEPQA